MKQASNTDKKAKKLVITRPILLGLLIGLGILAISILLWYNPEIVEAIGVVIFRGFVNTPCENASSPQCGGTCPDGELCASQGRFCYCIEEIADTGCGGSYPQCDGACPEGYGCNEKENIFDPLCYCERLISCSEALPPDCKGFCGEGGCQFNEEQFNCGCKSADSEDEEAPKEEPEYTLCGDSAPDCGGFCEPGYTCGGVTNETCECQEVTTSECADSYPDCSGSCGEDGGCVRSGNQCKCVDREPPSVSGSLCSDSEWPYCGGNCPDGMTCVNNEETASCVGDIFCYCDYV